MPQLGWIKARVRDESGFALVLALAIVVALGTAVASTTYFTTSNFHDSARSRSGQSALALAEAGLNMAYSTLTAAPDPTAATAVSSTAVPDVQMAGGFATYYGTYDSSSGVWTLTGIGKAYDTNHPGQFVVRAVHGNAQTGTGQIGSQSNGAWRYIYSDDPNSCATLSNNTTINVPVYVQGSLCLNNSARITGPAIQVGGKVTLGNQQTSIGTSTSPMTEIHIGHGCSLDGITYVSPCSSAQRVYGLSAPDSTLTPMSKPAIDLAGWYQNAQPGPMHGCTSGSFPGGFDTNTTMDRSRSTVDLTPNKAYDCRVLDATGNLVGRISWTPGSPGSLVIQGTIFFDGNITMSQLVNAQYSGRATIYSTGTITLSNQVNLCPVTGCDSTTWDPNVNLLAFVSGDSTDQYGFSIGNNSTFEGAVYCVDDYTAGNSSAVWGPVIARQVYLQNSTFNSFPPIMNLMSGMPSSYTTVTTVKVVAGSWSS